MHLVTSLGLSTFLLLCAACGDDAGPGGGSGGGGSGAGSGGQDVTSQGSMSSSSGNPQSEGCSDTSCEEGESCVSCNQAFGLYHECRDVPAPADGQFICNWSICSEGTDYCAYLRPPGDGCPESECRTLPETCGETPTCDCLPEDVRDDCTVDEAGHLQVTGIWTF